MGQIHGQHGGHAHAASQSGVIEAGRFRDKVAAQYSRTRFFQKCAQARGRLRQGASR
jgi:hypothetical protein